MSHYLRAHMYDSESRKFAAAGEIIPEDYPNIHGMCIKAEAYHLANLCLHRLAGRELKFSQASVSGHPEKIGEKPLWLLHKKAQLWDAKDLSALSIKTLYTRDISIGEETSLVVANTSETGSESLDNQLLAYIRHSGKDPYYGTRKLQFWDASQDFLTTEARGNIFLSSVMLDSIAWAMNCTQSATWPELYVHMMQWASAQLQQQLQARKKQFYEQTTR